RFSRQLLRVPPKKIVAVGPANQTVVTAPSTVSNRHPGIAVEAIFFTSRARQGFIAALLFAGQGFCCISILNCHDVPPILKRISKDRESSQSDRPRPGYSSRGIWCSSRKLPKS